MVAQRCRYRLAESKAQNFKDQMLPQRHSYQSPRLKFFDGEMIMVTSAAYKYLQALGYVCLSF